MKSGAVLPGNYAELLHIDLAKDKKLFWTVNGMALLIAALMVIFSPVRIRAFFDVSGGILPMLLRLVCMSAGLVAYIVLHELVHGVFMRLLSGVKPRYGFTLAYAYAGSDAYFNKKDYITIALAPIVIWGIVLAIVCAAVNVSWFWVFYFIQITNISGAAGDLYVTWKFSMLPKEILVRDTGVAMTVFAPVEVEK